MWMRPRILPSYGLHLSYFTIKAYTMCYLKGNASLDSQTTTLLALLLLSQNLPKFDPIFYTGDSLLKHLPHSYTYHLN